MINTLLIVISCVTLVAWFIQEKLARPHIEKNLQTLIDQSRNFSADDLQYQVVPNWNEWLFKAIVAMWLLWAAALIMIKDGDFALVLVVLTFLSGIIAGIDRLLFFVGRARFIGSPGVVSYLTRYTEEQRASLKVIFGQEMAVAEYAKSFFPILAVVLVLRSFVVEPFQIPSESMVPTLEVGDYILVNKYTYGVRLPVIGTKVMEVDKPERGDVMVFFPPNDSRYFIKRVVGLPGDKIEYKNKLLTINGKTMPQQLLAELPPLRPQLKVKSEMLSDKEHLLRIDKYRYYERCGYTVVSP